MSLLIRLTGSESEIAYTLTALKAQGYEWEGNNRRYPQRDNPRRFSCYLNDVIAPPLIQATSVATGGSPKYKTAEDEYKRLVGE